MAFGSEESNFVMVLGCCSFPVQYRPHFPLWLIQGWDCRGSVLFVLCICPKVLCICPKYNICQFSGFLVDRKDYKMVFDESTLQLAGPIRVLGSPLVANKWNLRPNHLWYVFVNDAAGYSCSGDVPWPPVYWRAICLKHPSGSRNCFSRCFVIFRGRGGGEGGGWCKFEAFFV